MSIAAYIHLQPADICCGRAADIFHSFLRPPSTQNRSRDVIMTWRMSIYNDPPWSTFQRKRPRIWWQMSCHSGWHIMTPVQWPPPGCCWRHWHFSIVLWLLYLDRCWDIIVTCIWPDCHSVMGVLCGISGGLVNSLPPVVTSSDDVTSSWLHVTWDVMSWRQRGDAAGDGWRRIWYLTFFSLYNNDAYSNANLCSSGYSIDSAFTCSRHSSPWLSCQRVSGEP